MKLKVGDRVKCTTHDHPVLKYGSIGTVIAIKESTNIYEHSKVFLKELENEPISFIYIYHITNFRPNFQLEFNFQ